MSTISSAITIHSSPESSLGANPSPPASLPYSNIPLAHGVYGNPLWVNAGRTPACNHSGHALAHAIANPELSISSGEPSTPSVTQMPRSDCGSCSSLSDILCSESIGRGYAGSPDSPDAWQLWTNRSFVPARRGHRMRAARYESSASNPFGFF